MSIEVVFAALFSRFDVGYDQMKDQQLPRGAKGEQHPLATRENATRVVDTGWLLRFLAGSRYGEGLRPPLERVSRQIQGQGDRLDAGRRAGIPLPRGLGVMCNARDIRATENAMQRCNHNGWTRKRSACTSNRGAQVQDSFTKFRGPMCLDRALLEVPSNP